MEIGNLFHANHVTLRSQLILSSSTSLATTDEKVSLYTSLHWVPSWDFLPKSLVFIIFKTPFTSSVCFILGNFVLNFYKHFTEIYSPYSPASSCVFHSSFTRMFFSVVLTNLPAQLIFCANSPLPVTFYIVHVFFGKSSSRISEQFFVISCHCWALNVWLKFYILLF